MKDPLGRTKVVLRHLPPAISEAALMDQIDDRFARRYEWVSFRPGKSSHKNQRYSRAYIDFKRPEDVVEFAEYFDGHVFVNERGAQIKALVEYAPWQRVPKAWSTKKDGREGTIFKDPEYLEFLEHLAKPVENLPSAEIQLERKEAERAGGAKESLIVTPLMDFVRQKRAAKVASQQRSSTSGKLRRRVSGASGTSARASSKRGSEKRRAPASVYVVRDRTKATSGKDKATYILLPRRESQQLPDKPGATSPASGADMIEDENGNVPGGARSNTSGAIEVGKRLVPLKGKERESSHQQQNPTSSVRNSPGSTAFRHSQRHETSGKIVRSILSNKEGHQSQAYTAESQSEQQMQTLNLEKDKRPRRPPNARLVSKDSSSSSLSLASVADADGKRNVDDKVAVNDFHGTVFMSDKHDKRTRNKDRPDRGVWTLRRSDATHGGDGTLVATDAFLDSLDGLCVTQRATGVRIVDDDKCIQNIRIGRGINRPSSYDMALGSGEAKLDISSSSKNAESRSSGFGRGNLSSVENGSHRHVGRRGSAHGLKEADGAMNLSNGKPAKRGPPGYSHHEKQVWVQKSGYAS